mmetsp:Transcript_40323/g.79230  ORF Transcript_40323/g.79230 Transcript_40323/m.79230 type:complete len:219 (+) Transcript_40323:1638-2294(+)
MLYNKSLTNLSEMCSLMCALMAFSVQPAACWTSSDPRRSSLLEIGNKSFRAQSLNKITPRAHTSTVGCAGNLLYGKSVASAPARNVFTTRALLFRECTGLTLNHRSSFRVSSSLSPSSYSAFSLAKCCEYISNSSELSSSNISGGKVLELNLAPTKEPITAEASRSIRQTWPGLWPVLTMFFILRSPWTRLFTCMCSTALTSCSNSLRVSSRDGCSIS